MQNKKAVSLCIIISLLLSGVTWGINDDFSSEVITYDVPDIGCEGSLLADDISDSNTEEFYDINIADANDGTLWATWLEFVPKPSSDPNYWRYPGLGDRLWIGKGFWNFSNNWQWEDSYPLDPNLPIGNYSHPTIIVSGNTTWLTYEYKDDPNGWHIYAGKLTLDPNDSFNPTCITSGNNNHINHVVAGISDDNIVIAWQEDNGGQFDIKICKVYIDNNNIVHSPEILVSESTEDPNGLPNGDWRPDVAVAGSDRVCVVWDSYINPDKGFDVLARWGDANSLIFDPNTFVVASDPNEARFQGKAQVVCKGSDAWIIWEEGAPNWGRKYTSINGDDGGCSRNPNYTYHDWANYLNATDENGPLHRFRRVKLAKLDQLGDICGYAVPMYAFGGINDADIPRNGVEDLGIYYEGGMITLDHHGRIWIAYRHFINKYCRRKLDNMTSRCVYEKGWKIYARCFDGTIWSGLYATSNKETASNKYYIYQQRDGMQRMSLCSYDNDSIAFAWDIGRTEREMINDLDKDRGICLTKADYVVPVDPNNPVAHWKLDEDLEDELGNNDGIWKDADYSGENYDDGPDGMALDFDGTDDYVETLGNIINPYETGFSAFMWVRLENKQGSSDQILLQQCDEGANPGRAWLWRRSSDNTLCSYIGSNTTASTIAVFENTGEWHHVGLTYNGSILTLYVDGISYGSASRDAESCTGKFYWGRFKWDGYSGIHANWDGLIDDVRIYRYAMSSTQVANLYNSFEFCRPAPDLCGVVKKADLEPYTLDDTNYKLTFGDLHRHTDISRCLPYFDGSIEDAYRYGIDAAELSFMSITDHSCDMDNGNLNSQIYWRYKKEYSRHQLLGTFIPYFGYERDATGPHYNFIFKEQNDTPPYLNKLNDTSSKNAESLSDHLKQLDTKYNFAVNAMAIPHWAYENTPPDWTIDEIKMPLLEIYQGCRDDVNYVYGLKSEIYTHRKHIGVIASSDHLSTSASYTCVWTKENSRDFIFKAMKNRRTYGATDKISLTFVMGTDTGRHWMGEKQCTMQEPNFTIRAKTSQEKGNAVISSFVIYSDFNLDGVSKTPVLAADDWYVTTLKPSDYNWNWNDGDEHYVYVKVIQDDNSTLDSDKDLDIIADNDDDNRAWSSPIWFSVIPVARWKLNETSGDIAYDNSDHHYDGTLYGPAWDTSDAVNGACVFNGDDYIEIDGGSDPNNSFEGILGGASRTVSAWIKMPNSALSGDNSILAWGTPEAGKSWILLVDSNGKLAAAVWGGRLTATNTALNDGKWHHVAAVFQNDGTPNVNEVKLYIDGKETGYANTPNQVVDTTQDNNILLGAYYIVGNKKGGYFNGSMYDVRIYCALSESAIKDISMLAHWPLDCNAQDMTAGQHHGETHNDPYWDSNGRIDGAIEFNGVDEYISVPSRENLHPDFPFSISMWIKPESLTANRFMIQIDPPLDDSYYSGACVRLDYVNGNKIEIGYGNYKNRTPYSDNCHAKTGTTVLEVDQWYHVVGVFDSNDLTIYMNGNNDGGTPIGTATTIYYNTGLNSDLKIGCRNGVSNFFHGAIDDVRFYNRKLSTDEISGLAGGSD